MSLSAVLLIVWSSMAEEDDILDFDTHTRLDYRFMCCCKGDLLTLSKIWNIARLTVRPLKLYKDIMFDTWVPVMWNGSKYFQSCGETTTHSAQRQRTKIKEKQRESVDGIVRCSTWDMDIWWADVRRRWGHWGCLLCTDLQRKIDTNLRTHKRWLY